MAQLPPGPRSATLATLHYTLDAYGYYSKCLKKYGDPFLYPSLYGPLVVTGSPEGIRAIFSADPDTFEVFGRKAVEPLFGPASIFLVTGQRHKRSRRLLMPPLHGARMHKYGMLMMEAALTCAERWRTGDPFVARETMQEVSIQIILRAVFGASLERSERLREAILETDRTINPLIVVFEAVRRNFGGVGPWARFQRALQKLDAVVYEEIAERRKASGGEDILSLLLAARHEDGTGLTDPEVRDELLSLVTAGHETTAIALSWALYWVHRQPEVRERLLAELDALSVDATPDAIAALPYLDAVCSETLRLYPIIPEVTRLLRKPLVLGGYTVPEGMGVGAITALAHMREDTFPSAEAFNPERFLARTYSPFEFMPFGGGARRCIGVAFAMYEMKLVLAAILRRYALRLETDAPVRPVRRSVPVGPRGGVVMRLEGMRVPARQPAVAAQVAS
ncbi:cytochrome P450 [Myxococcaceae bacterium JPH2]|nr:cytochrome P450 [Myxococcaceae bacterium JPH2]